MLIFARFVNNNKFVASSREIVLDTVHKLGSMCLVMFTGNLVKNFSGETCPDKGFLEGGNRDHDVVMDSNMPLEFVKVSIRISGVDFLDRSHCSHSYNSRPSLHRRWRRSHRAEVVEYPSPAIETRSRDTENRAYILFSPASFPKLKSAILHITANVPVDHHSRGSMLWKR